MTVKTKNFRIRGLVQGVYFRKYTEAKATELKLKGWVRNRLDGSVETCAQGDEAALKDFKAWLWQGSPASEVGSVEENDIASSESFQNFAVRGTE